MHELASAQEAAASVVFVPVLMPRWRDIINGIAMPRSSKDQCALGCGVLGGLEMPRLSKVPSRAH